MKLLKSFLHFAHTSFSSMAYFWTYEINVDTTKNCEDRGIIVANNCCKEEDQASMCSIKRIRCETAFKKNYWKP